MGVLHFVLAKQNLPCEKSHPGRSCSQNARELYLMWWIRIFPLLLCVQVCLHAAYHKGSLATFSLPKVLRLACFLFCSSGIPGYFFCLSKKLHPYGSGSRAGALGAAIVGSLSVVWLPIHEGIRVVTALWSALTVVPVLHMSASFIRSSWPKQSTPDVSTGQDMIKK